MPDFVIKISMPADVSGAQAAQAALAALTQHAGQAATAEAGTARATTGVGNAADKAAASVSKLGGSSKALHELDEGLHHNFLSLEDLSKKSEEVLSKLTIGFGVVTIGEGAIHTIEGIGEALEHHLHNGIEYLAEMENRTISLAATFRSVQPDKFGSFDIARAEAGKTIEVLKAKANELGVEVGGLVEAYSANYHALIEGGISGTAKQIQVISTLLQAEMGKGVIGVQAMKDSIDILNGRMGNVVVAKEIGLDEKDLKAAIENGTEYTYVMGKLSGQLEAAGAQSESFTNKTQTLKNEIAALEGALAGPLFDKLSSYLTPAKNAAGSSDAQIVATAFGRSLGDAVGAVEKFASSIESKPWLMKFLTRGGEGFEGAVGSLPLVGGAARGALENLRSNITGAGEDDIRKRLETSKSDPAAQEAADAKLAAEKRKKQDEEAQIAYDASPRGAATRDGTDLNKAALDQDKLNEKIEKHIAQLQKEHPKASQEWLRNTATNEVAAEHFAGSIEKLNAQLDKEAAKTATLHDVRQKLAEKSAEFANNIPREVRDKFSDEQIYSGNPATNGLLETLRGTQMDLAAKEKLLGILHEIVELEKERGKLSDKQAKELTRSGGEVAKGGEKAIADAADEARIKKAHDDALQNSRDENAILELRAKGQNDLADAKQKELDLQRDITALMRERLTYAEAEEQAARRQTLEQQGKDTAFAKQKRDEVAANTKADYERDHPLAFREGETPGDYKRRTGGTDARARDTDPSGGLHGGIVGSDFVTNNPPISSVDFSPVRPSVAVPGGLSSTFAGTAAAGLFGAPTAGQSIGGLLLGLGAPVNGGAPGSTTASAADDGTAAAAGRAATAAEGAKGAGDKAASSASSAAQSLDRATAAVEGVKGAFDGVTSGLKSLEAKVSALETKLNTIREGA